MAAPALTQLLLALTLIPVLLAATVRDLRDRTIPNPLTAAGALAVVTVVALTAPQTLPGALMWGGLLAAALGVLALVTAGGMGMGDAKLAGVLGLALGPAAVVALLVACTAATVVGLALAARDGVAAARRATVPLAPFLALGATLVEAWAWP